MSVLHLLVELFKTPAMSAVIGALAALLGIPLSQRLSRKAAESHRLWEQRARAYADLITAIDALGSVLLRRTAGEPPEVMQRFATASADFQRAQSFADLFCHPNIFPLLEHAASTHANTLDQPDHLKKTIAALDEIRPKIIDLAREDLGTTR